MNVSQLASAILLPALALLPQVISLLVTPKEESEAETYEHDYR